MRWFLVVGTIIVLGIGIVLFLNSKSIQNPNTTALPTQTPSITTSSTPKPTDITASFTIITDKITRSFKAAKYHNLSEDVYINPSDPTVVHVKKKGIT